MDPHLVDLARKVLAAMAAADAASAAAQAARRQEEAADRAYHGACNALWLSCGRRAVVVDGRVVVAGEGGFAAVYPLAGSEPAPAAGVVVAESSP